MKLKALLICGLLMQPPLVLADVSHVVFSWFKPSAGAQQLEAAIAAAAVLRQIPGVLELHIGPALASERDIVDDSFDIGITMRFESVAMMQAYVTHPDHVRYVDTFIKPYAERLVVYDIIE